MMNTGVIWNRFVIVHFLLLIASSGFAQEVDVNCKYHYAKGMWEWTIYLETSQQTLQEIEYVDYLLYLSSYGPTTVRIDRQGDPRHPWGHSGRSAGPFRIEVKIRFKNGRFKMLDRTLTFRSAEISQPRNIKAGNTATLIREGWWLWTAYITSDENVLRQVECVEYKLHPTFQDPIQRVCERGSGSHAFPLSMYGWGTFTITIRVFFRNGQIQELSHHLEF